MLIIPAVDIKDGRCVRLRQGRAEDETVYGDDPVEMARRWYQEGARALHVVDLDGAFQGQPVHAELIGRMAHAVAIPVQVGGGIRDEQALRLLLDAGVDRVILGTRALSDEDGFHELVERYGSRLAVGIDARDGRVQVRGWTETTEVEAVELAARMDRLGVQTIIYTDTARDGMLDGVNAPAMDALCAAVSCRVIASGGVSSLADVAALKSLGRENLAGAIVGKALYEGRVSLAQLQEAAA